ncbi:MAG: hypothetical protein ABSH47_23350 [Bryobacteraceae bacterium]
MKIRALAILAALLACGPLTAQDATTMWQFAPAGTKAFIGIRWHNIEESRIGRALRQQLADAGFAGMPFFGLLRDIDEAVIASPGKQPDDPEDKEAPVLIRVSGRFRTGEFERMMAAHGAHAQLYRQKRVYRQKKDSDMAVTLLDERTFLLGDAPSVFAALDRLEWPSPAANPLLARAAKLREDYDIWALFAVAPTELAGRLMPDLPFIEDAHGLELGILLRNGLDLRLGLDTESEESATKLADELRKALKLVMKDQTAGITAAAKKIQIAADKSSVRLTLRLDAAEVERSLAEAVRRRHAAQSTVAVIVPARPPPPAQKQTIRIEGLDDGPKEIPLAR